LKYITNKFLIYSQILKNLEILYKFARIQRSKNFMLKVSKK